MNARMNSLENASFAKLETENVPEAFKPVKAKQCPCIALILEADRIFRAVTNHYTCEINARSCTSLYRPVDLKTCNFCFAKWRVA